MPIRVLEIPLDDGTREYLATNLFDPAVTKDMFRDLYFYRWPVELKYKELKKSRFAMGRVFPVLLQCLYSRNFYIKYAFIESGLSYKKNEADEEIQISAKSTNKFRYQANRAFILDGSKVLFPKYSADCLSFQLLNSYIQMLYAADHSSCPEGHFQGRN